MFDYYFASGWSLGSDIYIVIGISNIRSIHKLDHDNAKFSSQDRAYADPPMYFRLW